MQKKALFNPRQTLVLAYLLAVVLWLVRCLAGSAVMLNYKMQGKMPQVTLAPDELTTESFAAYSSNEWWTAPDDDPNWYLSTDSDPHIYWQGQGYIETVELDAAHRLPPGGVALYYLKPGQTDYTEAQKVYAKVTAPRRVHVRFGRPVGHGPAHRPRQRGRRANAFHRCDAEPGHPVVSALSPHCRSVAGAVVCTGVCGGDGLFLL